MTNTETLIEKLSAEPSRVKPASIFSIAGAWAIGLIIYLGIMIACFGLRDDLAIKMSGLLFSAELGLLALLIITSAFSALLLSYPDIHQKPLLAFSPAPVFLLFVAVLFMEWMADTPPAPLPAHSKECLICISGLALLPAAFHLYRMRKLAGIHYKLSGSIALLSAFSIGAFILRLSEKTDSITHILEWHYLPMLGVALIGVLIGRLVLKW